MAENGAFYFKEDISYEKKGDEKFLKKDNTALLEKILSRLEKMDDFNEKDLEKTFAAFLEENDIKLKKIAQPLRVALTGQTFSPGIFEVMVVLGKQEVLRRLEKAIFYVKNKVE
jgi:glutamyl-tRNA synthetase